MDLILHHYEASAFAEKARLMLGFKGLSWKSVHTPSILPKPDLVALTGGYRRTPVLQADADVYCDTRRIALLLDELAPEPTLTRRDPFTTQVLTCWCDQTLFFLALMVVMQPAAIAHLARSLPPEEVAGFAADRVRLMQGATVRVRPPTEARSELALALERLERQLSDGRTYLLGGSPCVADLAAYHPVWMLAGNPGTAPLLDPYPTLRPWRQRIQAIGHGMRTDISAADALEVARRSFPRVIEKPVAQELDGIVLGERVEVAATDYGMEPTSGALMHADLHEIAIRRTSPAVGEVIVHFPRSDFRVDRDSSP